MQIMDQGDFGNHNNTGVKIVYSYLNYLQIKTTQSYKQMSK